MCDPNYLLVIGLQDVLWLAKHLLGLELSFLALHQVLPEKAKAVSSGWQANHQKSHEISNDSPCLYVCQCT